jgi:hypothetical protein
MYQHRAVKNHIGSKGTMIRVTFAAWKQIIDCVWVFDWKSDTNNYHGNKLWTVLKSLWVFDWKSDTNNFQNSRASNKAVIRFHMIKTPK